MTKEIFNVEKPVLYCPITGAIRCKMEEQGNFEHKRESDSNGEEKEEEKNVGAFEKHEASKKTKKMTFNGLDKV